MMKKPVFLRLCAGLMCIFLLCCSTAFPVRAETAPITVHYVPFADVPADAWYASAADFAYQSGLIVGVDATHFAPSLATSRAMLVSILYRSCGAPGGAENPFSDVPAGSWYEDAVCWAAENGIVSGTGKGKFSPDRPITREQMAAMLFRFAAFCGQDVTAADDLIRFPDAEQVSDWAVDAVKWAVGAELIAGTQSGGTVWLSPQDTTVRCQAAAILMRLLQTEPEPIPVQTLTYGTSGSDTYPLTAYQVGTGENVLLLTYAIHGWEDNFDRDGTALVYLAGCVLQTLKENPAVVRNGNWTVYILPCLNPDGLYLGTSCNGKGRCTTTRLDENGNLLADRGIDMNRCFPYRFSPNTDTRSFNGTAPLQAREALALAEFTSGIRGSGYNLCIDTHGWYHQVIAKTKGGSIEKAFYAQFPTSGTGNLANGTGYFSAWAAYELGYDACLFELPADVYSMNGFGNSGYIQRYEQAILTILATYTAGGNTRCIPHGELNGN